MKRPVRNPDIIWRTEKRKEAAILDTLEQGGEAQETGTVTLIISGMMHQLNLLGGLIWKLCDGQRGLDEVVENLAREFDVDRQELEQDVAEFIDSLVEKGWISYE